MGVLFRKSGYSRFKGGIGGRWVLLLGGGDGKGVLFFFSFFKNSVNL